MASFLLLTLAIFLAISIEILKASAWNPRIQRHEGYDLGKGPVFYEAYYRDEQTGNDNPDDNLYQDKRYFDRETVVERSYQVPANPYGPIGDRAVKSIPESHNQGSTYLQTSADNEDNTNVPRGYYVQGHQEPRPYEDRTPNDHPVQDYAYQTRSKIYVPEDRFVFGEPTTLNDSPDLSPYDLPPIKFDPDGPLGSLRTAGTGKEAGPRTASPEFRGPELLENIYVPRPQVINYVFSVPKERYQPVAAVINEPEESAFEAEANEWPRNYGDNIVNDAIERADVRELKKDETSGVESIEVSRVPRHKTRHHHGEWPKRNYSRIQ